MPVQVHYIEKCVPLVISLGPLRHNDYQLTKSYNRHIILKFLIYFIIEPPT